MTNDDRNNRGKRPRRSLTGGAIPQGRVVKSQTPAPKPPPPPAKKNRRDGGK